MKASSVVLIITSLIAASPASAQDYSGWYALPDGRLAPAETVWAIPSTPFSGTREEWVAACRAQFYEIYGPEFGHLDQMVRWWEQPDGMSEKSILAHCSLPPPR